MIRVLHVVGGLDVGGTETWLTNGLSKIDRARYHFDFLVYGDSPQFYQRSVEALGSRVWRTPPPTHGLSFAFSFLKILHANHYDAVHAHTHCSSGWVLALAAWAGISCRIFQSHTAQDDSKEASFRSLYFKFSRRLIQRYASRGVAVSHEAATPLFPRDWEEHPDRWTIAAGGIDLLAFSHPHDRNAVRRELGLPAEAKVIVHVGRFAPVKNHRFLMEVAREMPRVDPSAVLLLVGDGPGRANIAEGARSQSNIRFAGLRSDVPRILRACDAFVLPSLYEGFPLAYVEAQAAGLPCVISSSIAPAADHLGARTSRLSINESAWAWAVALGEALRLERLPEVPPQLFAITVERSMEQLLACYGANQC